MDETKIKSIVEAALMAADGPLTVPNLVKLFAPGELPEEEATKLVRTAVKALQEEAGERGVELKRVASGFRYQVRQELSEWVSRLWDEKPPRYTRALLETLALVAYKQPVTRGDIEQVRGVSVSQNIMRTLVEREWIKVVGHREVPGRPAEYGTTKEFLDYFNLKSLNELPPLPEIRALIEPVLEEAPTADGVNAEANAEGEGAPDEVVAEIDGEAVQASEEGEQIAVQVSLDAEADDADAIPEPQEAPQEGAEVVQLHPKG